MNPEESKLRQRQESEETSQESSGQLHSEQSHQQEEAREFATVEDLLRHDSSGNPVPPEIAERVNRSIAAEPTKGTSWLRKMFGK